MGKDSLDQNEKNNYYKMAYDCLEYTYFQTNHRTNSARPKTNNWLLAELIMEGGRKKEHCSQTKERWEEERWEAGTTEQYALFTTSRFPCIP